MKKSLIIITTLVLAVACFSLVACSNVAPQALLELPWNNYSEKAVYSVSTGEGDARKVLGTLEVSYEQLNSVNVDIFASHVDGKLKHNIIKPAYTEKDFFGLITVSKLNLDDGQYKHTIVITDKQSKAKYSYANSHFLKKGSTTEYEDIETEYNYVKLDNKNNVALKYNVKGNVLDTSGEIKLRPFAQSAYFDNAYYIALTRTLGAVNQARQVGFVTYSFRDNKLLTRVAANSARLTEVELAPESTIALDKFEYPKPEPPKEGEEAKPEEPRTKVSCVVTQIASTETMPGSGTPIVYLVAAVPYKYNDTIKAEKMLVKFVEHNINYDLKSVEFTQYSATK